MAPSDRTERLLAHLGLYRVSFRRIIERTIFAGEPSSACGNVLQALLEQERIVSHPLAGGPTRYYQLSRSEAARRAIPHRALALGGQALPEAIATLWFCLASDAVRHRLEAHELKRLFGGNYPKGPHALEEGNPPRLYRVYSPSFTTKSAMVVQTVRTYAERAAAHPALASWLKNRLYGFAVLASEQARRERLDHALDAAGIRETAEVLVAYAPDPLTIQRALHGLTSDRETTHA